MLRLIILCLIFISIFSLLFSIEHLAYEQGYIYKNILFYAEKALLAEEGIPPRLENIGFIYPPLAFLPFLFIKNYEIVSPIVSTCIISIFFIYLSKTSKKASYLSVGYLLLNPLVLFLATYRFEILLFYILLTLSVGMLIKHMESGYSFYLFASGILFGLTFFLDFRSLFLTPFVAIAIFVNTKEQEFSRKLALIIVKLSPIIFFALAWGYLNWVFTGNPFTFVKSPYSFFKSGSIDTHVLIAKGNIFKSLSYTILKLLADIPIILPYFTLLFYMRKYRIFYMLPMFMLYLSPIFLVFLSIYFASFFPAYYHTVIFLFFAIVFQMFIYKKPTKILMISFLISLVFSWILPLYSKELNEKYFTKFLISGKITQNIMDYKEVANILRKEQCKKTLIDDASSFPIVVFVGNPKMFYLPYMYEYYTVLSYPKAYADCIVVDKTSNADKISNRFPEATFGHINGYYLLYENKKFAIFKK